MLIALTACGRVKPHLDIPAGWECSWDGSDYTYRRLQDGWSTNTHPSILAVWVSAYYDWPHGIEPTAHWNPTISSLSAAEVWFDDGPEDYAFAFAVATYLEEINHLIFHG